MRTGNLSEFKRKLTPGSTWHCFHHGYGTPGTEKDMGTREVSIVQSNAVAFKMPNGKESWLYFPKASELEKNGNSFVVLSDGKPLLSYTLVEGV